MTPQRIQRRRVPGWRKPPGVVIVTRGTKWGNPFATTVDGVRVLTNAEAVALYREHLERHPELVADVRRELRGKTLCCWCALDQPCHADVLLEVANA